MSITVLSISTAEKQLNRDFDCPLMVSKAPLFCLRTKHKATSSESQQTLLERRRKRYHRLIPRSHNGLSAQVISNEAPQERITIGIHNLITRHERSIDKVSNSKRGSNDTSVKCKAPSIAACYPEQCDNRQIMTGDQSRKSVPSLLDDLECKDLVEHVVSRAKVRLKKRRKKKLQSLQVQCDKSASTHSRRGVQSIVNIKAIVENGSGSATNNSLRGHHHHSMLLHRHQLQPLSSQVQHHKLQPDKEQFSETNFSNQGPSISQKSSSLSDARCAYAAQPLKIVYWSERHSVTPKSTGVPNVPPVTPSASYSRTFKFILSMSDVKSQRQLKNRLNEIFERQQASLIKDAAAKEEQEKRKKKEEITKLKEQQRAEIYALNKVMAAFEEQKFHDYVSGRV